MSLPKAFVEQMQAQLGPEWPDFAAALEASPPVSIHYNRAKAAEQPLFTGHPVPWNTEAVYLETRPVFTLDPHFHAGRYYVQEAGSMLLVPALQQIQQARGETIRTALDLCGAPGGKTTLLLNQLPDDCLVVTNEVIKHRFNILYENRIRWGRSNVINTQGDSAQFARMSGLFDLVLVDAPCSGEGLFRKNPQAREEWSAEHVQFCASRQRRILHNALPLVSEGGFLIYSTCTYNPQENDQNVEWICEQGGFEVFPLDLPEAWGIAATRSGYQAYPHRSRSEGFYLSVLQKTAPGPTASKIPTLRYFTKASRATIQTVAHWLPTQQEWEVVSDPQEQLYLLHPGHLGVLARLSSAFSKIVPGISMGTLKGKQLVPGHALALAAHGTEALPGIEVNQEAALAFLRKQELRDYLADSPDGWQAIRYDGYGLGWVKVLPRRVNNYLPKSYRIRMEGA